jgi:hypothetical protein
MNMNNTEATAAASDASRKVVLMHTLQHVRPSASAAAPSSSSSSSASSSPQVVYTTPGRGAKRRAEEKIRQSMKPVAAALGQARRRNTPGKKKKKRRRLAGWPQTNEAPLGGVFTVERIIGMVIPVKGSPMFEVKWQGYDLSQNTMEPVSNLTPALLKDWADNVFQGSDVVRDRIQQMVSVYSSTGRWPDVHWGRMRRAVVRLGRQQAGAKFLVSRKEPMFVADGPYAGQAFVNEAWCPPGKLLSKMHVTAPIMLFLATKKELLVHKSKGFVPKNTLRVSPSMRPQREPEVQSLPAPPLNEDLTAVAAEARMEPDTGTDSDSDSDSDDDEKKTGPGQGKQEAKLDIEEIDVSDDDDDPFTKSPRYNPDSVSGSGAGSGAGADADSDPDDYDGLNPIRSIVERALRVKLPGFFDGDHAMQQSKSTHADLYKKLNAVVDWLSSLRVVGSASGPITGENLTKATMSISSHTFGFVYDLVRAMPEDFAVTNPPFPTHMQLLYPLVIRVVTCMFCIPSGKTHQFVVEYRGRPGMSVEPPDTFVNKAEAKDTGKPFFWIRVLSLRKQVLATLWLLEDKYACKWLYSEECDSDRSLRIPRSATSMEAGETILNRRRLLLGVP